ncbi:MAG: hypothetical protein JXR52_12600 [Bacteroidales bacterium]|nr:hypothetical protein [Bacteroidales bacterium]MBN2699658.1 hypothetical protein [Bacteroidales bacterium]
MRSIFFQISIVISIYPCFFSESSGQTIEEAFGYAGELFRSGDYEQTELELRRILFHSDILDKECYLLLSECTDRIGRSDRSFEYMRKALVLETDDSIRLEMKLGLIQKFLKSNQPIYSLLLLHEIRNQAPCYAEREILFYLVATHYLLENYSESEENLHKLSAYMPGYDSASISHLYKKSIRNERKRTFQYSMYSAIIPGSGQLLSGAYRQGIDIFLLNSVIFSCAGILIKYQSVLDAILTVLPFIQRYYLGNIITAKKTAEQQKEEKKYILYNQLLDIVNEELHPE